LIKIRTYKSAEKSAYAVWYYCLPYTWRKPHSKTRGANKYEGGCCRSNGYLLNHCGIYSGMAQPKSKNAPTPSTMNPIKATNDTLRESEFRASAYCEKLERIRRKINSCDPRPDAGCNTILFSSYWIWVIERSYLFFWQIIPYS
jgi:hypothetical protein